MLVKTFKANFREYALQSLQFHSLLYVDFALEAFRHAVSSSQLHRISRKPSSLYDWKEQTNCLGSEEKRLFPRTIDVCRAP